MHTVRPDTYLDSEMLRVEPMHRRRSETGLARQSHGKQRQAKRRERAKIRLELDGFNARDRGCRSKKTYPTEHAAKIAAKRHLAKWGLELRPYKCRFCHGWHLTKQPYENPTD